MLMILLNIAIVLLLIQGIVATTSTGVGGSATIGYQPTSGVEEQWVAEEEFHGASQQHQPKQYKKKKKKVKDSLSYPGHEHINEQSWWDEDDTDERLSMQEQSATLQPSIVTKEEKKRTHRKKHRIRIWKDKSTTKSSVGGDNNSAISKTDKKTYEDTNSSTESTSSSSEYDEEHPMRTDEWQLNIQLSRLYSNKYDINELFPECDSITDRSTSPKDQNVPDVSKRKGSSGYRKRQVMQFARNGYVKILVDDHDTDSNDNTLRKKPRVGKWRIGHSGVAFDIPVQISPRHKKGRKNSSEQQPRLTTLHYHADIHLNKFGERPRMFRGVITRDRYASSFLPANFLRPVIGTFSAEGIGHDTSDTSYRERAISLSRQQVINEAKV